jgi:hypothetical protein
MAMMKAAAKLQAAAKAPAHDGTVTLTAAGVAWEPAVQGAGVASAVHLVDITGSCPLYTVQGRECCVLTPVTRHSPHWFASCPRLGFAIHGDDQSCSSVEALWTLPCTCHPCATLS